MISVVIPAYNEEKLIKDCLEALAKQRTKRDFEVILVDNNSTDKTAEIAKTFTQKLNLKIILEKKKGRGFARATGCAAAQGAIILSTDADAVVGSDWVEKMGSFFEQHPESQAVTGPSRITDCSPFVNGAFNIIQPLSMRLYRLFFGQYWLNGFNFGMRTDFYHEIGGFQPELNALEDLDLAIRTAKKTKIWFVPSLTVVFSGRRFQGSLLKGLSSYVTMFIEYYWLKKQSIYLDDPR